MTTTIPAYLEDERRKRRDAQLRMEKKLRASSRCTMATIALRNSPRWNCHRRLKPQPKREKLPQQLGKSHAPREDGNEKPARWRDSGLRSGQDVAGAMGSRVGRRRPARLPCHFRTGRWVEPGRSRRSLHHDLCGQNLSRAVTRRGAMQYIGLVPEAGKHECLCAEATFIVSLVFFMGIAIPSRAQATKPAPPTPIDEKKVELGGIPWNPHWDQIIHTGPEVTKRNEVRGMAMRSEGLLPELPVRWRRASTLCKAALKKSTSSTCPPATASTSGPPGGAWIRVSSGVLVILP
jgi:hypothetical protein